MAEMTPRERSELVRRQSRDYIMALRENRLQRATSNIQPPAPVRLAAKLPSAFYPSKQATARAFEAKAKSSATANVSPREEAAVVRQGSAASIAEMRGARHSRVRAAQASPPAAIAPAAKTTASAKPAVSTALPDPLASATTPPPVFTTNPAPARAMADETPASQAPVRRARAKKTASTWASADGRPEALPPQDIDVISGLGPALKSKLRQAGIVTVDILSAQKPDRLREVLGPAGRLVNLEALVRAATTACAERAPDAAAVAKARTAPKAMPSQRTSD